MLINNWTFLNIEIGSSRLNLSDPSTLVSFVIIASEDNKLPALEFIVSSSALAIEDLESNSCADNFTPINVVIGPNENALLSMNFRLISWKKLPTEDKLLVKITGILDNLPYILNTNPNICLNTTMSSFAKVLATEFLSGYTTISNTTDIMLRGMWGRTASDTIDEYCKSAWSNSSSLFLNAVDIDGTLSVVDIINNMNSASKNIKVYGEDTTAINIDYITKNTRSDRTLENAYSTILSVNNIIRDTSTIASKEYTNIRLKGNSGYSINLNKNAKSILNTTKYISKLDIGNGHKEFYSAIYNNVRLKSMINNSYKGITSGRIFNLPILGTYNLFMPNNNSKIPVYVSKKIFTIINNRYEENYILNSIYTPKTTKNLNTLY